MVFRHFLISENILFLITFPVIYQSHCGKMNEVKKKITNWRDFVRVFVGVLGGADKQISRDLRNYEISCESCHKWHPKLKISVFQHNEDNTHNEVGLRNDCAIMVKA